MSRPCTAVFLCGCLVAACSVLPSGQLYTFAKVAPDQSLIPARSAPAPAEPVTGDDSRIRLGEYLNLTLKGGFLRYLEAIDRPEVLLFVRVKVRSFDTNQEALVWEQVHLHSERKDQQMVLAKDSFLPRFDIPILPAFEYSGEQLEVNLRIVELDEDDNQRWRSIINVATATTAALRPESATAGSAFQALLTFVTANNPDDIEFQFDFALHPDGTRQASHDGNRCQAFDVVLQPRVGTYVVVKTEHQERLNLPSNWFDVAHHGVRYGLAQVLKLGTLGLFNWSVWTELGADRLDDFYLKIMGRPFAVDRDSWALPEFVGGKLGLPGRGGRLHWDGDRLVHRIRGAPDTFRAQSYLVLGIDRAQRGLDLIALRTAASGQQRIDGLVKAGQPSAADFDASLQKLGSEMRVTALGARLTSRLQPQVDEAVSSAQIAAALREARLQIDQWIASGRIRTEEADVLARQAEARAQVGLARLGESPDASGVCTHPTIALAPGVAVDTQVEFAVLHPVGTNLRNPSVGWSDGSVVAAVAKPQAVVGGRAQTNISFPLQSVPKGPTSIEVSWSIDSVSGSGAGSGRVSRRLWLLPAIAITGVELVAEGQAPVALPGAWLPGQTVQFRYAPQEVVTTIPGIGMSIQNLLPGGDYPRAIPVRVEAGRLRATNVTGKEIRLVELLRTHALASEPARLAWQPKEIQ